MKRITGMLLVAGIVAFVAAGCGSSSGGGTTPSATPSATSTRTLSAMGNATMWMSNTVGVIPAALASTGASVKIISEDAMISCTGTAGGFECVIWDASGSATSADHKCDVTGSYSESAYTFDLAYDCYTYEPATDVTVDGNWTASLAVNDSMMGTSASVKDAGVAKEDTSGTCEIEDIANACGETFTTADGSCTVTCGSALACSAATAIATVQWTAGSRGVYMTDVCGTYDIAVGTASTMSFCMPSSTQFIMSASINGTINGTSIDENLDIDCTFSS